MNPKLRDQITPGQDGIKSIEPQARTPQPKMQSLTVDQIRAITQLGTAYRSNNAGDGPDVEESESGDDDEALL